MGCQQALLIAAWRGATALPSGLAQPRCLWPTNPSPGVTQELSCAVGAARRSSTHGHCGCFLQAPPNPAQPSLQHLQGCLSAPGPVPLTRTSSSHQDSATPAMMVLPQGPGSPDLLVPHFHACSPQSHRLDHSQIIHLPFNFSAKLTESFVLQPTK